MRLPNVHWVVLQEEEGKYVEWEGKEWLGSPSQLPWPQEVPEGVWGVFLQQQWRPPVCVSPGVHSSSPWTRAQSNSASSRKGGREGQVSFASPWRCPSLQEIKKASPLRSPGLFFFGNIKERQGRRVRGLGSKIFILFVASVSSFLRELWVAVPDLFLSCMSNHSKRKQIWNRRSLNDLHSLWLKI